MIMLTNKVCRNLIQCVDTVFNQLTAADLKPCLYLLNKWGIEYKDICNNFDNSDIITPFFPIKTQFGLTSISNLALGFKICILAQVAINQNKAIGFYTGSLGENAFRTLVEIARGTRLITLYSATPYFEPWNTDGIDDQLVRCWV